MIIHDLLVRVIIEGLDYRVEQGIDRKRLSIRQLAQASGLHYSNLAAIMRGKPATESTWQKLLEVAYPLPEGVDGS